MTVTLRDLVSFTNKLLKIEQFSDYCPNGLQIEGKQIVGKIVTGVTASEALIDAAIVCKADAILVHHGYFWKNEDPCLIGMKGMRVKKLMQNEISLLSYHLPLDAHAELGNNKQLAEILEFSIRGGLDDGMNPIGFFGELKSPMKAADLYRYVADKLGREPLYIGDVERMISTVAWCTGAAQSYIEKAILHNVDCFLTGEVSESTVHIAREMKIGFFAAGHHATERYGIKALGEYLSENLNIECEFIDILNPV